MQSAHPAIDPQFSNAHLRIPDLIDALAREGVVLRWDSSKQWYEVLDAHGFEARFNALRCVRGKRKENAADRPFARMHVHFVLVRGEKWAGNGSAFRPKSISPIVNICASSTAEDSALFHNGVKRFRSDDSCPQVQVHEIEFSTSQSAVFQVLPRPSPVEQYSSPPSGFDETDEKDEADDEKSKHSAIRLQDIVEMLAKDGQALRWDDEHRWYEVVDGPLFESRFNMLRSRRGKRKEDAQDRPFARMHIHFVLVRGDKWAGTGSAFRSKFDNYRPAWLNCPAAHSYTHDSFTVCDPSCTVDVNVETGSGNADYPMNSFNSGQGINTSSIENFATSVPAVALDQSSTICTLSADQISVGLRSGSGGFRCSLQHFLDVTGAGDMFSLASTRRITGECSTQSWTTNNVLQPGVWAPDSVSTSHPSTSTTSPADSMFAEEQQQYSMNGIPTTLGERDVAGLVGTMWNENSLGDQAYFFPREQGCGPFFNGAVVELVDGRLRPATILSGGSIASDSCRMFMVVSDNNVKWKGEPIPTPDQEKTGHWCAFLGQVPLRVRTPVRFGSFLGPAGDGSGYATVATLGVDGVVGVALSSCSGPGVVKTLCFAGFNALSPLGVGFRDAFQRALKLERVVEELSAGVEGARADVAAVRVALVAQDLRAASLEARIEVAESQLVGATVAAASAHVLGMSCVSNSLNNSANEKSKFSRRFFLSWIGQNRLRLLRYAVALVGMLLLMIVAHKIVHRIANANGDTNGGLGSFSTFRPVAAARIGDVPTSGSNVGSGTKPAVSAPFPPAESEPPNSDSGTNSGGDLGEGDDDDEGEHEHGKKPWKRKPWHGRT